MAKFYLISSFLLLFATKAFSAGIEFIHAPVEFSRDLNGLNSVGIDFVIDFTYSPENGVRVIELGPPPRAGSRIEGHNTAHPTIDAYDLTELAVNDYSHKSGLAVMDLADSIRIRNRLMGETHSIDEPMPISLKQAAQGGMFWIGRVATDLPSGHAELRKRFPNSLLYGSNSLRDPSVLIPSSKALSLLLYNESTKAFTPPQLAVASTAFKNSEMRRQVLQDIQKLPGSQFIIKGSTSSRGAYTFLADRSMVETTLEHVFEHTEGDEVSVIVQEYLPTRVPRFPADETVVGRVYMSSFYHKGKITVYPITSYWKISQASQKKITERDGAYQLVFPDEDKKGRSLSESEVAAILPDLTRFTADVFAELALINEFGPQNNIPHLAARFANMPTYQQMALTTPMEARSFGTKTLDNLRSLMRVETSRSTPETCLRVLSDPKLRSGDLPQ